MPVDAIGSTGGADLTIDTQIETVVVPLEAVGVTALSAIALFALVYAAVLAGIQAIYLGGLDRRLRGEPIAPSECLRRYTPRLFLYVLAVVGVVLSLVPVLAIAPALVLLAFPAVLVVGYLFYAAPFLFVVEDAGFLDGFRRSFDTVGQNG